MGAISSYPYDIVIQDKDAWIGTDSVNRQTKQYSAEALVNYLNTNGKVSIGGQMVYKFSTLQLSDTGTFALPNGGGAGVVFSDIDTLKISTIEKSGQNVIAWLEYLVSDQILISSQSNLSYFGHYTVLSYTVDPNNSNFYTLALSYIGGNGNLIPDEHYDIVNFSLAGGSTDKTYVHNQSAASATWNIQHNLAKFPSVTIVDNYQRQFVGEIEYINNNEAVVTLSSPITGKAYLN